MKKTLLNVLLCCFVLAGIAACAESKDGGPADVNPAIAGSYKVDFFGTQVKNVIGGGSICQAATLTYITNDCDKAKTLYPDAPCQTSSNSTISVGKVTVGYDAGQAKIISKMQMSGSLVDMSPRDKYQYTVYNSTSKVEGTGVQGANFDNATSNTVSSLVSYPDSPFKILADNGTNLDIEMTLKNKKAYVGSEECIVDAVTRVQATKVTDDYNPLENTYENTTAASSALN